jgi:hypothetical protein
MLIWGGEGAGGVLRFKRYQSQRVPKTFNMCILGEGEGLTLLPFPTHLFLPPPVDPPAHQPASQQTQTMLAGYSHHESS